MTLLETTSPSTLQSVAIFLVVLNCVAVSLRFYTRQFLSQSIKVDDWFSLAAFFFVLALTVYYIIGISNHWVGYALPEDFTWEAPHPLISGSLLHFYVFQVLIFPTLWLIKSSFVLFYRRVLVADHGNYREWANLLVIFTFGIVTLWSLGFGFTWAFACNPPSWFWSFPYGAEDGPCLDTWALNQGIVISDFLVDVLVLLIPIPMVWRLQLPTGRKLAVLVVFFLGSIAVAASIMRMQRILWVVYSASADEDPLLLNSTVLFWGLIEADLGLLAACLPTLRGLLKTRTIDSLLKSYRSRSWLRSSQRSNSKTGEPDGLPLTNPSSHKASISEYKDPYTQDMTLTSMNSVNTRA